MQNQEFSFELITQNDNARLGKISTPSYNQVNKPIYSKSVGRWKNYEKEFTEIYPIIEPWIKNFNY